MKPGTRLKSAVCDTEVVVVRGGGDGVIVECGGAPMGQERPSDLGAIDPGFADGSLLGKRYVDAGATIELLCVKPGQGTLSMGGEALRTKDAKALPSSD